MKDVISRELLSEVLEKEIIDFHISGNTIWKDEVFIINIHELAHKCKEWANKQRYSLRSELKICYCRFPNDNDIEEKIFRAETEVESIFKSCQWILENKND